MRDPNLAHDSCRAEVRDYIKVAASISLVTLAGWFAPLSYNALGYIYLLVVIALSLRISRWPALAAAVLSSVAWNFFFVPPRLSFSVLHFDESLLLITFFAVALIGSQLTALRSTADRAKLLAESERLHQTLLDTWPHELKTPSPCSAPPLNSSPHARSRQAGRPRHGDPDRHGQPARQLVGNLLNQTRLESGMLKPQLDWCEARDLVPAARRAVGSRLEGHPAQHRDTPGLPHFAG